MMANAAFYFGLVRALADGRAAAVVADVVQRGRGELPRRCPRRDRRPGLLAGRRHRVGAPSWCCAGCCRAPRDGLDDWGLDAAERDRLLGIIEQRCLTGRNGATWQTETFHQLFDAGRMDRFDALREVVRRYREHMHENIPVHEWPVD